MGVKLIPKGGKVLGVIEYLSLGEFAERAGIRLDTAKRYLREGRLPEPDARVGRNRGWLPATVDQWHHNRLGQGHRSDLS